ncbi:hypothetical protein Ahy_A09g046368 [Arachis hypogaea]|uniref:MULE transposase domain-containing protein n=1 Tax=Arachis hypogaea TaxID=3818 RepID=A0A445BPL3_ARAHY|nr:hypothetical protein Ahy_A09g046368 [Arachis hypogaea]
MKFRKNDNKRVRAVCKVKDCKWVVYASRDHGDMKTFLNDHTCPREDRNRAANRNWVVGKLMKKRRKYPDFRNCEATTFFKTKYDLSLNRNSISQALCDARNVVYGNTKEQYAMLRDYGETLLKTNPRLIVQICTKPQPSDDVIFERMYIYLSGCKSGFRAGFCPLIGLNGAFLKTVFGGKILSTVGQDANHHIYVIAWTIVEVENFENWKWFLELLHEDHGDYKTHGWNFISDIVRIYHEKLLLLLYGLLSAMTAVIPDVGQCFCKDLELRGLLWECARETTFKEFKEYMDRIKRMNEDAWAYLDKWSREAWTRSQFRHNPKLDSICNNACEVFNSKIKEVRGKLIVTLLEEVRMFVMRTMAKNKVKLDSHLGLLPPVIKSRLEKVRKESRNWHAIWAGDTGCEKFEVYGRPTNHAIDLEKDYVPARIPCIHACVALARVNKHPKDFCHKLITMESYKETYKYHINPLSGQAFWEQSQYNRPLAPPIKRKSGNLQTKRRKDSDEGTSSSKKAKPGATMKKQVRQFTCKYCLQKGHTKRECEKKKAFDVAAATKAVEVAKDPKNATPHATATATSSTPTANATAQATATATTTGTATATATAINNIPVATNDAPIGQFTKLNAELATKPTKLPTRRSPSPTPTTALDPMKDASSTTISRFTNFLKFVSTPGFKHSRKK